MTYTASPERRHEVYAWEALARALQQTDSYGTKGECLKWLRQLDLISVATLGLPSGLDAVVWKVEVARSLLRTQRAKLRELPSDIVRLLEQAAYPEEFLDEPRERTTADRYQHTVSRYDIPRYAPRELESARRSGFTIHGYARDDFVVDDDEFY